MTAVAHTTTAAGRAALRLSAAVWVTPLALFGVALLTRLLAMNLVRFPLTEGSAYYTAVAHNLATGRGLTIDAIWSYSTPPLILPRPAFELWQPLASAIAVLPMPLLGATFASAQLMFALLGALVAPLTWFVARDAARRLALPDRRATTLSIGAGLLAALFGPFVLATVVPDSTLPFTVLAVGACALMPAALTGDRRAIMALGLVCGLAYLARMEAAYLAVTFVAVGWTASLGWRQLVGRGVAVAVIAALVALPWWLRNLATFGTALPGQIADNLFLERNEQIFAYADPPTLAGFLGQGGATIVAHIVQAFRHDIVNVLLIPGGAIAVTAVVALLMSRRHASQLSGSPLGALLILGAFTLGATSVLFPVATLWGTFEHAAGPLLVALIVVACLGADAAVARVRAWRDWPRSNAWLAPAALIALTLPITLLQVSGAAVHARAEQDRFAALSQAVPAALAAAGVDATSPIITDRPIWLSEALGRPAIALPDEPAIDVRDLASDFNARAIVVVEQRGRHPAELAMHRACFSEVALGASGQAVDGTRLFVIAEACQ